MNRPELRAEPRVPVTLKGTLTLNGKTVACAIQNMCTRGFLIRSNKELPVGQRVRLTCELYPDHTVECEVQVRHVNRDCLGAKIMRIGEQHQSVCRRFLEEQRALQFAA